jgi:hypothetical protein
MERLTPEQAYPLISKQEDQLGLNPIGYTITPSDDEKFRAEDGWEDVTYYTARKKQHWRTGDKQDWVYVLSNAAMPGILKIGYTRRDLDVRVIELSKSTGVATPFKLEWAFNCYDGDILELEVHRSLEDYRVTSNKEFFAISIEDAKASILKLGERFS